MIYTPCKWVGLEPGETMRTDKSYRCFCPVPEPTFPVSVTNKHGHRWPPLRCYVGKEDCARCPCFEAVGEGE